MLSFIHKNKPLQKIYFQRTEIEKILILSTLFGLCLSLFRIIYTGRIMFLGLSWNLFLAFVPYWMSSFLKQHISWIENKWKFSLIVIAWLLFIPNSFYIITDLFHLERRHYIPLWFDLVL